MTKELVIAANRHETKVALLEDDQLVEIYFQRQQEYSLAGSVHKGRVTRVLPGMQSAFVDLGLERDTFLYVSDFFEESEEYEKLPAVDERPARREGGRDRDRDRDRDRPPRQVESRAPQPKAVAPVPPVIEEAAAPPVATSEPNQALGQAGVVVPPPERRWEGRPERGGPRNDRSRDDRNGRGRRGRRRGRGGREERGRDRFPDNKYADSREEAPAAPLPVAGLVEPKLGEPEDFAVLPGESLRKYSRPGEDDRGGEDDALRQNSPADQQALNRTGADLDDPSAGDPLVDGADLRSDHGSDQELDRAESDEEPDVAEDSAEDVDDEEDEEDEPESAESVNAEDGPPVVVEAAPEPLQDPNTGLNEDLLDQIQQQAEIMAARQDAGEPVEAATAAAGSEIVPEEAGIDGEAEADEELEGELDLEADEEGEEAVVEAGAETPAPVPGSEDGGPAPPLASMESIGSSHREQTSRFLRGRRMRRRRGQPDPNVRTVNREGGEAREPREGREPREAPPPREGRGEPREPREPREARGRDNRESREQKPAQNPSIQDLLKEGQEIVVQVAKEPMGQKGARITSHIALPGRYCVYMPTVEHLGVSRKIASDEERLRLRRILQTHREGIPGGFIIRTAGEGKTEEQIAQDIQYLSQLWIEIKQRADQKKAPALLYHDVEIVQRLLRDQLTDNFKAIWVDNEQLFESVVRFVQRMAPGLVNRVKLYTRAVPIFDAFNIAAELEKALRPKVWLKSGGYIVINQTEALVAIDVNTGKFVGKSNRLEDTIVKTNTDAVKEIVRQIRLRDLGGIIVVDFIDMDERRNRQKVMQALEEAMRTDRAPNKILQFNDFGLVAITRKRVKQSLERTLCAPCAACEGSGYTKSVQTVINEILIEAQKLAPHVERKDIMLRVHPTVAVALKSRDNDYLEELEETFGRPVMVTGDATLHPEKFDVA